MVPDRLALPSPMPLPELGEAGALPVEAAALVQAYQRASKADATVRAYRADAEAFGAWCAPLRLPIAAGQP
ncbi:hypothetical protein [Methylobacterium isbiliense]|jgi:hypothetical protein|uniref:Integrase n=1 Tax=Methylobacterium isbiliense TaxID=315478 RepID=A0ABQ4SGD7_9HYPH|nr:hypothetical protein [Methylobacterium isbiliense]MDN3626784.1 hypothetical protein [Methylobacterium isbiliense]GJE02177.1 hypothetical protein GMJLKIPL_4121 [Methylobacterium isbiliense]